MWCLEDRVLWETDKREVGFWGAAPTTESWWLCLGEDIETDTCVLPTLTCGWALAAGGGPHQWAHLDMGTGTTKAMD